MEPAAGLTGSASLTVTSTDTARAVGSGSVEVLATPRLLALCEEATVATLDGHLDEGLTSVGVEVRLDHVAPSPVGRSVTAEANLEKVVGRRLHFTISAHDDRGLVAAAKVTRVIVDQAAFMAKCGDG